MARWIGFCAPGTKPFAWLAVLASGEQVVEIYESEHMAGRDDVILANLDGMGDFIRDHVEDAVQVRDNTADLNAAFRMDRWIQAGGHPAAEVTHDEDRP